MSGRERVLTLRLLEKLNKKKWYGEILGIEVGSTAQSGIGCGVHSPHRENETCGG